MKKFICCVKEEVKDELLKNKYKLISVGKTGHECIYVFENKSVNNYSLFCKKNIFTTNRLNF